MLIYTDGGYSPSTDLGGIGIVFVGYGEYYKKYKHTTNQRMELKAVLVALQSVKDKTEHLEIYSDSAYVVNTINMNYNKFSNTDLWDKIYAEKDKFKSVKFIKVKGHSENKYNNRADKLAQYARL